MSERAETIASKTPWRKEADGMIRAGSEQKSIANQRAFKSLDHNPQFLCVLASTVLQSDFQL